MAKGVELLSAKLAEAPCLSGWSYLTKEVSSCGADPTHVRNKSLEPGNKNFKAALPLGCPESLEKQWSRENIQQAPALGTEHCPSIRNRH